MTFPYCGNGETEVTETRDSEGATRRRRVCEKCSKRFTTYERVEIVEMFVIKKDGRRERFDREKLKRGILKAVEKRPVSIETVEAITNEVEMEIRNRESTEISSKQLGSLVLRKLRRLDKVAYVRFASVYLDFDDLNDFERLIEKLT